MAASLSADVRAERITASMPGFQRVSFSVSWFQWRMSRIATPSTTRITRWLPVPFDASATRSSDRRCIPHAPRRFSYVTDPAVFRGLPGSKTGKNRHPPGSSVPLCVSQTALSSTGNTTHSSRSASSMSAAVATVVPPGIVVSFVRDCRLYETSIGPGLSKSMSQASAVACNSHCFPHIHRIWSQRSQRRRSVPELRHGAIIAFRRQMGVVLLGRGVISVPGQDLHLSQRRPGHDHVGAEGVP
ncbi:hypothetical protein STIN111742_09085 [Stenotrophomonas indicatrix]